MLENKDYKMVSIKYIDVYENYIYALSDYIPFVFVIDAISGEVIRTIQCSFDEGFKTDLYSGICVGEGKLVVVPRDAEKLWIYDLVKSEWIDVDLKAFMNPELSNKFVGCIVNSGTALLFGYNYNGVLALDLANNKLWDVKSNQDSQGHFIGISSVSIGEKVIIPMRFSDRILVIDPIKKQCDTILVDMCSSVFNNGITFDGEYYYILKNSGDRLYKISQDFSSVEILSYDEFSEIINVSFDGIVFFGGSLILFGSDKCGFVFNIENPQKSCILEPISFVKVLNDGEVIFVLKDKIEILDEHLNVKREIGISVYKDDMNLFFSKTRLGKGLLFESNMIGLSDYVKILNNYEN